MILKMYLQGGFSTTQTQAYITVDRAAFKAEGETD